MNLENKKKAESFTDSAFFNLEKLVIPLFLLWLVSHF